jgi:hypothetical protein
VEELLFIMNRDRNGLTPETALLTMLLRLEKQLKLLTDLTSKRK